MPPTKVFLRATPPPALPTIYPAAPPSVCADGERIAAETEAWRGLVAALKEVAASRPTATEREWLTLEEARSTRVCLPRP